MSLRKEKLLLNMVAIGGILAVLIKLVPIAAKALFWAQELQSLERPDRELDLKVLLLFLVIFILVYILGSNLGSVFRKIKKRIDISNEWKVEIRRKIQAEEMMREKLYCDIVSGLTSKLSKEDSEALICTIRDINIREVEATRNDLIRLR